MQHTQKQRRKPKKEQLAAMLARPNGVRISVIGARFGWQAHSVRAAISGLRKSGFEVVTSKSAASGETIYSLRRKVTKEKAELNASSPLKTGKIPGNLPGDIRSMG